MKWWKQIWFWDQFMSWIIFQSMEGRITNSKDLLKRRKDFCIIKSLQTLQKRWQLYISRTSNGFSLFKQKYHDHKPFLNKPSRNDRLQDTLHSLDSFLILRWKVRRKVSKSLSRSCFQKVWLKSKSCLMLMLKRSAEAQNHWLSCMSCQDELMTYSNVWLTPLL